MAFGNRLKTLREERGLSQVELAKILNIANSTLSLYESGSREPNFEILKKIANYFNVSTDYILGRNEVMSSQIENEKSHNIDEKIMNLVKERFTDKIADLTEEQQNKVLEYIEFLISKSSKNN